VTMRISSTKGLIDILCIGIEHSTTVSFLVRIRVSEDW